VDVASILNPRPLTVRESDALSEVVRITLERHVRSLPVLDAGGRYVGMVSLHRILELLLPRSATVAHGLADLAFVHDSLADLRAKLENFGAHRVADYMDRDAAAIAPETQVVEAALLMFRTRENLPVVERSSGRLVGLVSPWEILQRIA
jgi:CBS domain-containing protein